MPTTLAIALAGIAGVLGRYLLDGFLSGRLGTAFPWGTVIVNVLGCFLAGVVWAALSGRSGVPEWVRPALAVGFLGGFTTFSAFALQTVVLAESGSPGLAAANVAGSLVAGLGAAWSGAWLVRAL